MLNAKTQRPGVCNAAETLLVHEAVAGEFLPRVLGALRAAGVELRGDERRAGARRRAWRAADRVRLGRGVPRARARGQGRRLRRGGDRARQRLRLGPLRGDRDPRHGVRAGVPARRRRRLRLRQRLDALHRRRRVRDGRRDRQLDPEAARPRPDRPARAVHVQVPGRGRRARSAADACASACSAGRSTRRTSAISSARRRRGRSSGSTGCCCVPVHTPPHKEVDGDPGVRAPRRRSARLAVAGDERLGVSRVEADVPGRSYTVDTLTQAA